VGGAVITLLQGIAAFPKGIGCCLLVEQVCFACCAAADGIGKPRTLSEGPFVVCFFCGWR
jgi:hypothetical protein